MSNRLAEILDGLQARLEGELRGGRGALTHPSARGDASESDWIRVLNDHMPHRYRADKAFVVDCHGETSEQIDIVIYDRQYSPLLFNQSNQRYVPSESAYCALEVKQDLSREQIEYAGEKVASVRRLHRTCTPIQHAGGTYPVRPLPRILGGIVAYECRWSPPFGTPFRDALATLDADSELDIGCSLLQGAFEAKYSPGSPASVTVVQDGRALIQFFLRLLKQLQSLATAPAIDYEAYLTGLCSGNTLDGVPPAAAPKTERK
jgi:hypothetical protein